MRRLVMTMVYLAGVPVRLSYESEWHDASPAEYPHPHPFPTRAGREGDSQPMPTINDGKFIQDLVIEDINDRTQLGISRYGTALQPFNGRDALQDAYEEALDLCCYLKQAIVERDTLRVQMKDLMTDPWPEGPLGAAAT